MAQRNVINTDAVDDYVAAVAELAVSLAVRQWIRRSVRRWILREHKRCYLVVRDRLTEDILLVDPEDDEGFDTRVYDGDLPDWALYALDHPPEDGSDLVFLRLDGTLSKRIRRVIVWLNDSFSEEEVEATVARLGFAQAEGRARKWRRKLKGLPAEREPGAVPVFHYLDATIVQLTSPGALRLEGDRMRHCVGEYDQLVAAAQCEIYSVRDTDNKPHATIEVDHDGTVLQIKGFANGRVDQHWRLAIRAFVQQRNYVVVGDAENIAVLEIIERATEEDEQLTIDALDRMLCSAEGRHLLRAYSFVGRDGLHYADCEALARLIIECAHHLSADALRSAYRALAAGANQAMRTRPTHGYWVYDIYVPVLSVALPLPLLNMARKGIFREVDLDEPARQVLRAAQDRLPTLAFRQADCVFNLGPRSQQAFLYNYLWTSPADFLADGDIDTTAQRRLRHQALRRRMNQAKARVASRNAPRSEGHEAVRALLSGAAGPYVI